MAVENGSIREKRTARSAGERVVIDIRERRNCSNQVRKRNLVGVPETAIHFWIPNVGGVGWVAAEPIRIRACVVERNLVRCVVLMDQAPVPTELECVLAFGPTQIVDNIVDRDACDCRTSFRGGRVEESEVY